MPDASQKEVGRRLYHVHREKRVEEAIKKTDLVYFLTGPDKIEIGVHEELLEKNDKYQGYLAHQLEESYSSS